MKIVVICFESETLRREVKFMSKQENKEPEF